LDLLQLSNEVTKETSACFEPAFDYVVTKVPRWDMKKFDEADPFMGSAMKSVGEVMAIGRTFEESLQKALRMVKGEANGFDERMYPQLSPPAGDDPSSARERLEEELARPSAARIWALAEALAQGYSVERLHALTSIDPWFIAKLQHIQQIKEQLATKSLHHLTRADLIFVKKYGFSDRQIANYIGAELPEGPRCREADVWVYRQALGVAPVVKQIDTLAAEFPAQTNYLYLTFCGEENDVEPLHKTEPTPSSSPWGTGSETGTPGGRNLRRQQQQEQEQQDYDWRSPYVPPQPGSILSSLCNSRAAATAKQAEQTPNSDCYVVLAVWNLTGRPCPAFLHCALSATERLWEALQWAFLDTAGRVNCNPETVSTDYDVSDRLYFEDLTLETVSTIWDLEQPRGVIISVGGQTPNNLCNALRSRGVGIMGTDVGAIDCCEDRHKFSRLCDELRIDQPAWSEFSSFEAAQEFSQKVCTLLLETGDTTCAST
ncbi:Carbamoyl-phosphate synthase, large subunit, related, partial [Eimeria maxima]